MFVDYLVIGNYEFLGVRQVHGKLIFFNIIDAQSN